MNFFSNQHRLAVADHPEGVVVAGVEDEGAGPAVLGVRSEAGEKFRFGAREEWQKQRAILLAEGSIDPVHEGVDIDVGRHGADDRGDDLCGHLAAGFAVRQWWEGAFGSRAVDDGGEVIGGDDGVLKGVEGAFGEYGLFDDGHVCDIYFSSLLFILISISYVKRREV